MYSRFRKSLSLGAHLRLFSMIALASLWCGLPIAHAAKFKGAWFEVDYPDRWAVVPSLPSKSRPGGVDSVFFRSPDSAVEFYVFAPQWSGEAQDIVLDRATERLDSSKTSESGGKSVRWYTISARNGAYTRSYEDTKGGSTRVVVGIKYRSEDAYREYRSAYLQFKKSLRQFAD